MHQWQRMFGDRFAAGQDRFYNDRLAPAGSTHQYGQPQPPPYGAGYNGARHSSMSSTLSSFGNLSINGDNNGNGKRVLPNRNPNMASHGPPPPYRGRMDSQNSGHRGPSQPEFFGQPPSPPLQHLPYFAFEQPQQPQFGRQPPMMSNNHRYGSNNRGEEDYWGQQQQPRSLGNNRNLYATQYSQSTPHLAQMAYPSQQAAYQSMANVAGQHPDPPVKKRLPKYIPRTVPEDELFREQNHIQPGDYWDQMFGTGNDGDQMFISSMEDGSQLKNLVQSFNDCNFSPEIMRSITLRKYKAPTPIQKGVITVIQKRRNDLMAHAQTGSGKSAAFLLPIISEIQAFKAHAGIRVPNGDSPFALVIVPTKELAEQLYKDGRSFAINTGITVQRTYGDMWVRESKELLKSGCDVCIVTCGRLRHFVGDGLIKLQKLRYLVLDEADKLLTCANFQECVEEIKHHPEINPDHRMLMFSATFSIDVQACAQNLLRPGYIFIRIGTLNSAVEIIKQSFIEVGKFNKQEKLLEILKENAVWRRLPGGDGFWKPAKKTLVFVELKRQSDRLTIALGQEGFHTISLNSDRTLEQRIKAVNTFTLGVHDVMISTDVAARGLNFPNVDHVINFDLPEGRDDRLTYIHRIGRTGRAGNSGLATSFFDPNNPEDLRNAQYYIEVLSQFPRNSVPDFLYKYADESQPNFLSNNLQENPDEGEELYGTVPESELKGWRQRQVVMENGGNRRDGGSNSNSRGPEEPQEVDRDFWTV